MGSHRVGHNWSDLAAAAAACGKLVIKNQEKSDVIQDFRKFDISRNYFKERYVRRDSEKQIGAFQQLQNNRKC